MYSYKVLSLSCYPQDNNKSVICLAGVIVLRGKQLGGKRFSAGWCKTWTLDSGLDSWTGLWTEIWTRFWTDAQGNDDHFQETMDRRHGTIELQLQARLVTSSLVRTFPGPSGYEVKSQGASLEATYKHVEVAKSVSPAGMASPHRNGLQYHRDAYEG